MNIGFIGLGKLGLPCALAIEEKGHTVVGTDISEKVRNILSSRKLPYLEEGAQELLLKTNIQLKSIEEILRTSDIVFVPIQTPHLPEYEGITRVPDTRVDFNYDWLVSGLKQISDTLDQIGEDRIVVVISTVLPGTIDTKIRPWLSKRVKLCYNPFFIAMGTTIKDFTAPEFVLLGVDDEIAAEKVSAFYGTIHDRPVFRTQIKNAELIKVAYNTFIGMKIAFINTMMEICYHTGADVDAVSSALELATERIISPKYMRAGMGDGGGCHPRDNIALSWLARSLGLSYDLFDSIMIAREEQTMWLAKLAAARSEGRPIVVLGKAYKPETNLTVGSPSLLLVELLRELGFDPTCYDPHVDAVAPDLSKPAVFIIGTKHGAFLQFDFPEGSHVLDPWGYIPNKFGITVERIGR
jgi:UDPglucose 6-dehydrogenase